MVLGIYNPLNTPVTSESEYEVLEEAHIWGEIFSRDDSGKIDIIHRLMTKGLLKATRSDSLIYNKYILTSKGKSIIKTLYKDKIKSARKYKLWGDE